MELVAAPLPKMQANNVGVRKDRFPDKNLDCRTPTASDWKTNRTRSPVGTTNTLMHQHYNDLQSSSSGLAVWVFFFAKDPRVTPSIIRTASVFFQPHRKHARILRTRWLSRHIYCPPRSPKIRSPTVVSLSRKLQTAKMVGGARME